MVRRLPQLSSTQINWFDSSISSTCQVVRRFSKRLSKHALNSRSIHKWFKLQSNWFKYDGLCKRHKNTDSPICQTLSSLTSLRCTKTISRPGMASYRTSLLTSHSMMEMCFSCFVNTKYKCLRCKLPICNKCSVLEENKDVEGWRASKKRKAGRALHFGISLTSPRSN